MKTLIDADVLAYRCLAAATSTEYLVIDENNEIVETFIAGVVDGLSGPVRAKSAAEQYPNAEVVKQVTDPPISHVIHNIKEVLETVHEQYPKARQYLYLSCDGPCWRHEMYPEYKGHRPEKPKLLPDVRELLKLEPFNSHIMDGYEADDVISMEAHKDPDSVIVSNDKDFKQIPGVHFNPFTKEEDIVGIEEATRNLWVQVLMGDSTDNIKGIPRVGLKTAEKLLGEIDSLEDYPDQAFLAYESRELTMDDMLFTYRLVKLLETEKEKDEIPDWYVPF